MMDFGCQLNVHYDDHEIKRAKEELKEVLFQCLEQLCERDDFWIIKHIEGDPTATDATVGWRIQIKHMKEQEERE